jgi:serine protease
MRKRFFSLFVLALAWMFATLAPAQAQSVASPDTVLVKFNQSLSITAQSRLIRGMGLMWTGVINRTIWVVRPPAGWTPELLVLALSVNPNVEYVELNSAFIACMDPPADPFFTQQWNLAPFGPSIFGVNALSAWNVTRGRGVNVAVLDTGIAYEDAPPFALAADIDASRTVLLSNWVNKTTSPDDDHGHGTFLCSVIGETMNNELAAVGIAPECTLMAGKVLNANGIGYADQVANGIYEAVTRGAQIILLASVCRLHSRTVQDAIDWAAAGGVLVVCPAGNDGKDLDANPGTVAFYHNSVVVSALDRSARLATYSNFGSRVDLSAPGGDYPNTILAQSIQSFGSPIDPNSVVQAVGSSIAAAHVAGVMALCLGANRSINSVIHYAHDLGAPGRDPIYGLGMVDAGATVGGPPVAATPGNTTGNTGSTSGTGGSTAAPQYDVALTQMRVASTNNFVNHATAVIVTAANNGSVADQFTVRVIDETTGATIGEQAANLAAGAQADLTFPWTIQAPAGTHVLRAVAIPTHTPETNTANNQVALAVGVTTAPLTLTVQSYAPSFSDNTTGTNADTFRVGYPIGLRFTVTDGGAPVSGQPVHFTLRGATGAVVMDMTVNTNADGIATAFVSRYSQLGGIGIYTCTADTTRDTRTATGLTYLIITPLSRSMQ